MMDSDAISSDRRAYAEYAQRFWTILKEHGPASANSETEQSSAIVGRWANKGCIAELLTPLLSHEMESVRYAAAADLLNHVPSDAAVNILKDIADNPQGLLAPTAKLFLLKLGKSKGQSVH